MHMAVGTFLKTPGIYFRRWERKLRNLIYKSKKKQQEFASSTKQIPVQIKWENDGKIYSSVKNVWKFPIRNDSSIFIFVLHH